MTKIIINNKSSLEDSDAVLRAYSVVVMGRISDNGKSYCYVTGFPDAIVAVATRNKSSDTITILDDNTHTEGKTPIP